jgi:hypothetical protein
MTIPSRYLSSRYFCLHDLHTAEGEHKEDPVVVPAPTAVLKTVAEDWRKSPSTEAQASRADPSAVLAVVVVGTVAVLAGLVGL